MQARKLLKILIVFFLHITWTILLFINKQNHRNNTKQYPYNLNILFSNAAGIEKGTLVNYRGVCVGKVSSIDFYNNYVLVLLKIESSSTLIPISSYVKTYQTIFMASTTLCIYDQHFIPIESSKKDILQKLNSLYQSPSFCYHNDIIYGFQGASLDYLIDILIRLFIQLDNTDLVDSLYNLIQNFDTISTVISKNLVLKNHRIIR